MDLYPHRQPPIFDPMHICDVYIQDMTMKVEKTDDNFRLWHMKIQLCFMVLGRRLLAPTFFKLVKKVGWLFLECL
jgi:hypothetical protein